MTAPIDPESNDAVVVEDTRRWLRRAVIALNLCPFAKSVDVKDQVHYAVSHSVGFSDLLSDLRRELTALQDSDARERDTTLFIVPDALHDFLEYNDFLNQANRLLAKQGWEGVFQIASLHPQYQFADEPADAVTNNTNRSPYPTLHLLREESIDRAVAAFPHAETIFETNMRTMERIGQDGWRALDVGPSVNHNGKLRS